MYHARSSTRDTVLVTFDSLWSIALMRYSEITDFDCANSHGNASHIHMLMGNLRYPRIWLRESMSNSPKSSLYLCKIFELQFSKQDQLLMNYLDVFIDWKCSLHSLHFLRLFLQLGKSSSSIFCYFPGRFINDAPTNTE